MFAFAWVAASAFEIQLMGIGPLRPDIRGDEFNRDQREELSDLEQFTKSISISLLTNSAIFCQIGTKLDIVAHMNVTTATTDTKTQNLLTKKQAALRLNVSPRTISRYEKAKLITAVRITARTIRFQEDQIERLISDSSTSNLK